MFSIDFQVKVKLLIFILVLSTHYFLWPFAWWLKNLLHLLKLEIKIYSAFLVTRSRPNYWSSTQQCPLNSFCNHLLNNYKTWHSSCHRDWIMHCTCMYATLLIFAQKGHLCSLNISCFQSLHMLQILSINR